VSFIREVSELAVKAEKKHGVPASALAAIAIAESSYGWTRPALEANNLFAWKAGRAAAAAGKLYVPPCERRRGARSGFLVFASRAEAFDYVASRLAAMTLYREHTDAYRAARKRGDSAEAAVDAWLSAIAGRYSSRPQRFAKKIRRIMNDPVVPSDTLSPSTNLYRLSAGARVARWNAAHGCFESCASAVRGHSVVHRRRRTGVRRGLASARAGHEQPRHGRASRCG
jgi:hypothetical protein